MVSRKHSRWDFIRNRDEVNRRHRIATKKKKKKIQIINNEWSIRKIAGVHRQKNLWWTIPKRLSRCWIDTNRKKSKIVNTKQKKNDDLWILGSIFSWNFRVSLGAPSAFKI